MQSKKEVLFRYSASTSCVEYSIRNADGWNNVSSNIVIHWHNKTRSIVMRQDIMHCLAHTCIMVASVILSVTTLVIIILVYVSKIYALLSCTGMNKCSSLKR